LNNYFTEIDLNKKKQKIELANKVNVASSVLFESLLFVIAK